MRRSGQRCRALFDIALDVLQPRTSAASSESGAVVMEKAASAHHRGRPRCSDKHSGHSGASSAATFGQPPVAAISVCYPLVGRVSVIYIDWSAVDTSLLRRAGVAPTVTH